MQKISPVIPANSLRDNLRKKKLVVFDLDGTLAESKAPMQSEMKRLLKELLAVKPVAIISGGKYELFWEQFLKNFRCPEALLKRLYIFPTSSTRFYRYERGRWKEVYVHALSVEERKKIIQAFEKAFQEIGHEHPKKTYGLLIEDRGTQVTFSALGQKAPGHLKKKWKEENTPLKMKIQRTVQKYLPNLEVRAAGYTSIDVTKKGIDKQYGIGQIKKYTGFPIGDMLFVGDALYKGGNDYAVRKAGVASVGVDGPEDTKRVIRYLLKK